MARARGGGGAGYAWALVVLGLLFLVSLIFAIVFYNQNEALKNAAESAETEKAKYVKANEESLPAVKELVGGATPEERSKSVVRKLLDQREQLTKLISPEEKPVPSVEKDKLALQDELELDNLALLQQVRDLHAKWQDTQRLLQEQAEAAEASAALAKETEEKVSSITSASEQNLSQIQAAFDTKASDFDQLLGKYEGDLKKLVEDSAKMVAKAQDDLETSRVQVADAQAEIDKLRRRIADLLDDTEEADNILPSDGEIVSIDPEDQTIYINRGREDYIKRGMAFEIFNPDDLIKLNDFDELRGKATIEVYDLSDRTAKARIARVSPGVRVEAGDVIANLVYDPNMTHRFYVYGDFDIDNDGEATVSERKQLETKVLNYGGMLADEFSYEVDYLILGQRPPLPEQPNEDDPVAVREFVALREKYNEYQTLQERAKDFSIPVLNQNRALALLGFYDRNR